MPETIFRDLIHAGRMLRKAPAFAAAAIATLALGIGANTAIFSVIYAVLLQPLPYADPANLYAIHVRAEQFVNRTPSMPSRVRDFLEWRRSDTGFSDLAIFRGTTLNLTGDGEPERLDAVRASSNLFPTLGVQPEIGRNFLPEEDAAGRNDVVILSHDFWVRRYGGDPAILRRTIQLDGRSCRIAGVLPASFVFPTGKQFHPLLPLAPRIDVWIPIAITDAEVKSLGDFDYGAIGRLKPGVSAREARQRLDAISAALTRADRLTYRLDLFTRLIPIRDIFAGNARRELALLLGAAGLLLLIACVNLANLSMARMTGRTREFATRAALGASRSRLVRQVLTESVLLSGLGGAAALLVAKWGTVLMAGLGPAGMPMLRAAGVNSSVLLFTTAVALASAILFGLAPALQSFRGNLHEDLKSGGRGNTEGPRTARLRGALVTVEVALSTALLAAAGLLLHSFVNVMNVDKGFGVERILAVDLALAPTVYTKPAQRVEFFRDLTGRVSALPGVTAAGAVTDLPLTNEATTRLINLESDVVLNLDRPVAANREVTPGYFAAIEIPLLAGRYFREMEPVPAAVISESLARGLWPGVEFAAVPGRRIRRGGPRAPAITVVGVVSDVKTAALDRRPMPQIYRPYPQDPVPEMSLVIRSAADPASLARAVRAQIRAIDPNLPVAAMRTMREIVSASVAERRFQMALILAFALVALALTLVGIYGVVSYQVACRTAEIGLRMALGAGSGAVLRAVLSRGLAPVAVGLAGGVAGAAVAARLLQSFLFGVSAMDPLTLAGVGVVLLLAAIAACYVPARRAARVDPMTALRSE